MRFRKPKSQKKKKEQKEKRPRCYNKGGISSDENPKHKEIQDIKEIHITMKKEKRIRQTHNVG